MYLCLLSHPTMNDRPELSGPNQAACVHLELALAGFARPQGH